MKKIRQYILRLYEGELNVMELLWSNKTLAAKDIAELKKIINRNKTLWSSSNNSLINSSFPKS